MRVRVDGCGTMDDPPAPAPASGPSPVPSTPVQTRRRMLADMDADRLARMLEVLPEVAWALDGAGPLAPYVIEGDRGGPAAWSRPTATLVPLPATHSALAQVLSRPEVLQATIVRLDALALALLDLVCFHGTVSADRALAEVGDPDHLATATDTLVSLLLVEPGPDGAWLTALDDVADHVPTSRPSVRTLFRFQPPTMLEQALARWPVGSAADTHTDRVDALAAAQQEPEAIAGVRDGLSDPARALLDRLVTEPNVSWDAAGFSYRGHSTVAYGASPVIELWQLGLVGLDFDDERVTTTGEAVIGLTGRYLSPAACAVPPRPEPAPLQAGPSGWPPALVLADLLLDRAADDPIPALKSGGIGVRAVRALAKDLDVPAATVGTVLQLLVDLGLLGTRVVGRRRHPGRRPDDVDLAFAPTDLLDGWREAAAVARWRVLLDGWTESLRLDEAGGLPDRVTIGPTYDAPPVDSRRTGLLGSLLALPAGCGVDRGPLAAWLAFQRPLLGLADALDGLVAALRLLGLVPEAGPVGITDLGRQVLGDGPVDLLPATETTVVVQADLTVIAPPDLDLDLLRRLRRWTVEESAAGARVLRLDEAAIARALDGGDDIADVRRVLADHSRTDLPQTVTRLLDDVARRRAALTVGAAASYLVATDPTLLANAVGVTKARLTLLAPTVAVSSLTRPKLQEALRQAGVSVTEAEVADADRSPAAPRGEPLGDLVPPTPRMGRVLYGAEPDDLEPDLEPPLPGTDTTDGAGGAHDGRLDADERRRVATRLLLDEGPAGQVTADGRWIPADGEGGPR